MTSPPDPRQWASTVSRLRLRASDADLYVLQEEQEILRALGREPVGGTRRPGGAQLLAVARVVMMVLPFLSLAAFGGRDPATGIVADPMSAGVAVPYSAIIFLLALPGPPLVAWWWWRSERRRDLVELVYLGLTVVVGARILQVMATGWGAGVTAVTALPVWATAVLALVVLAAMVLRSRGPRSAGDQQFRRVAVPDPERVAELVGSLRPHTQERLLDTRRAALSILQRRGLIDRARMSELVAAPLGLAAANDAAR